MTRPDVELELRPPRSSTALYGASLAVGVALVVSVLTTGGPVLFTAVFVAVALGITG